jgi:uncharacterized membrane protein
MSDSSKAEPGTIEEYLAALREAFGSADRALVQDALYDAEEYLRAELANRAGQDEATVLRGIVGSYGAPAEVAAAYQQTEVTVQRALKTPRPVPRSSALGAFFGVFADPRCYGALFYMLFAILTGIFYFTWAVTGAALSLSLMVMIFGIPLLIVFLASVRMFSLLEGRLVEVLLGVRMPRRPLYPQTSPWLERIGALLKDRRTWTTLLYMMLMMPLGILYFTIALVGIIVPVAMVFAPLVGAIFGHSGRDGGYWFQVDDVGLSWPETLFMLPLGILGLTLTLHLVRGIGRLHGQLARALLVEG